MARREAKRNLKSGDLIGLRKNLPQKNRIDSYCLSVRLVENGPYTLSPSKVYCFFFQVKHSRECLITHPLVVFLLDRKWRMYGRKLFYVKLFVYLIFLLFLTGYVIMATPSQAGVEVNGKIVNCTIVEDSGSMAFEVFVDSGRYILLILACLHIVFEVKYVFPHLEEISC